MNVSKSISRVDTLGEDNGRRGLGCLAVHAAEGVLDFCIGPLQQPEAPGYVATCHVDVHAKALTQMTKKFTLKLATRVRHNTF